MNQGLIPSLFVLDLNSSSSPKIYSKNIKAILFLSYFFGKDDSAKAKSYSKNQFYRLIFPSSPIMFLLIYSEGQLSLTL